MRTHQRRRARPTVVALLAAVGLILAGSSAGAVPAPPRPASGGTYLALGDSVPFGYRGDQPTPAADHAFTPYPQIIGQDLHLRVLDASCPGETTGSFIDVAQPSNGCENGYRAAGRPLHVTYDSAEQSQLDYAVQAVKRLRDVRLVTLQLGANDAFLCQADPADRCDTQAEEQAVADKVRTNLDTILKALRTEGGYRGRIDVVTYYALDYGDEAAEGSTEILDRGITQAAHANHAAVADGFEAFKSTAWDEGAGSSTRAGLVLAADVHPSLEGQELLAWAVELGPAGSSHRNGPGARGCGGARRVLFD